MISRSRSRLGMLQRQIGDRYMTYIAAFHCQNGIVMCADTQETRGEYKNYVEKIEIIEDLSYPLAIGGAGVDDIIKPFMQEVTDRVKESKPKKKSELKEVIRSAIKEVYEKDVPVLVVKKQHLTPHFLIAAKPSDDELCIFPVIGRRLYGEVRKAIIGYPSSYNNGLLDRLYRNDLPMQQAVMLATYLVSQSKKFDDGVGGDTQVVIVRDNGAWIDDPQYVKQSEVFIGQFLQLIDELFLNCVDSSIPPSSVFPQKLEEFGDRVKKLRYDALVYAAARTLNRTFRDPTYKGDPYSKVFPGATTTVMGNGTVQVREESKEETEKRRRFMEAALLPENIAASAKFNRLLEGRQILYIDLNATISNYKSGST
jgi:20S proteasome alpha/beta subunit